jgi:acyl-CoA thioesterase
MRHRKLNADEVRDVLRKIPFARMLGARLARLHRDGITLECTLHAKLLNSAGALHGGVSAALADAAVGVAIHRHFGRLRPITTVEMKINYFRPVTDGCVYARSRLLRVGSMLCIGRVDIADADGRTAGTAIVTYMLLGPSAVASS